MEADTSEKHSSIDFMDIISLTFMFDNIIIPAAVLCNNATNTKI